MRIVRASVRHDALPLATPFVTAVRRVDASQYIVLQLHDEHGNVSEGSAPELLALTGESLETIERTLQARILPALLHHDMRLDQALSRLAPFRSETPAAAACTDIALHALAARQRHIPLWQLLGAKRPAAFTTAVTVSLDTPSRMRMQAIGFWAKGFRLLKLKVGGRDGLDVERIQRVAHALPDARLLVDANQAWDADTALKVIHSVASLRIELIEQPVPGRDIDALAAVTMHSPLPVLADEAVFSPDDARRLVDARAADAVNIKLMKCGGLAPAAEIAHICREADVPCMLGSMLEGPVSIAAAAHFALAHADIVRWVDLDSPLLYRHIPEDFEWRIDAAEYRPA